MKPFPYQKQVVRRMESFGGRTLVAADMGTGKTFMTFGYLHRNPKSLPAIVVCPASVKWVWEEEAKHVKLHAQILEGQKPKIKALYSQKLIVINYDILRFWLPWLRKLKPQTIILDEIQATGNPKTKKTESAKALCRGVPHIIGLSGTPLVNRPVELFSGLQMIRPDVFKSRWKFCQEFCDPEYTPWGWQYKGVSNPKKLHKLLRSTCLIRLRKDQVLKDLPKKIRRVVPLPITDPNEYKKATDDFLGWLKKQDPQKAAKASKAEALVRVGGLLRLSAKLKLPYVIDWVNQFLTNTDDKLILFAVHKKMIEGLRKKCNTKLVVIDGSVPTKKRKYAIEQFQSEYSKVRLLIGNIKAAGEGITLTSASNVAFAELPWQPGAVVQCEDRAHRLGQKDRVCCWYLIAKGTIEEKLCSILQSKQKTLSAVLDGGPVEGDLDVYSQLMKEIRK